MLFPCPLIILVASEVLQRSRLTHSCMRLLGKRRRIIIVTFRRRMSMEGRARAGKRNRRCSSKLFSADSRDISGSPELPFLTIFHALDAK